MTTRLLKKPAFWIAVLAASALCVFVVLRFFGDAFSVLDLDVRMSRGMAIDEARRIVADQRLAREPLVEAAAGFSGDAAVQTFVELEGGGKPALKPLIAGDEYTLHRWRVRLFTPGVEHEVQVAFTPDGRTAGFFAKVPEAEAGAALGADAARAIARASASRDWDVDFTRYRPLTASSSTRPGGRIDHEFVYERTPATAPSIGEGRLRLRLVVTGDRLTQLRRHVFVPEAFVRRYESLRSVNTVIASAASVTAGLLYGLAGCLVGLIWLMRRDAVRWGPAAVGAGVVATLTCAASLAAIPGGWLDYDTATSASAHLFRRVGGAVIGGVVTWLLLTVIFATAEGLGRAAFGRHPQLWRTWRTPSANSRAIWGRTLAGYAWIGFDLAFIAGFYVLVQRYLGWWSPSDALIDPNILGAPQPWIAPVALSLQAGTMEEALFRAVPIAGAALLGRHFGRERSFVIVALVLQAIVFGAAHANYPGQPAYARPVELFVPSLVWGLVYLRYGLVPGMLFHFGFDLVLMSIPLFVTDAPGLVLDRAIVIAILSLPLVVLAIQRWRTGSLVDLPDSERNAAARPSPPRSRATDDARRGMDDRSGSTPAVARGAARRWPAAVLIVAAAMGAIGYGVRLAQPYDGPGLTISRERALAIAVAALAARGVSLDDGWHRSVRAIAISDPTVHRFAWREGGSALYRRLLGTVLPPPHWEVRFARFDGDLAERETWRVSVVDDRPPPDGLRLIEHDLPEGRPGRRLSEAEARPIAERAIETWLKQPAPSLRAVAAEAIERPNRVDWVFTYADPGVTIPAGGEARIVIEVDGEEVVSLGRTLFVPDAWSRDEKRRNETLLVPRALAAGLLLAFAIGLAVSVVRRLVRGEASKRAAWVTAAVVVVTVAASGYLAVSRAQFGFTIAEPFGNQMLRLALQTAGFALGGGLVGALVAAVGVRLASRGEAMRPSVEGNAGVWGRAAALALVTVGFGGLALLFGASTEPRLPSIAGADSLAPWAAAFVGELDFAGSASALLLVTAMLAGRRRVFALAIAFGVVATGVAAAASIPDTPPSAIVGAGVAMLGAILVYHLQLRDRPWIVAPFAFCLSVLLLAPTFVRASYPGSIAAGAAGFVALAIGYAIWRWLVTSDRSVRSGR